MTRLLGLGVGVLAALWLTPAQASGSTLAECLAARHVCVAGDGRSLVSQSQQAQLERQIGGDDIYLVVAASGSLGLQQRDERDHQRAEQSRAVRGRLPGQPAEAFWRL